MAISVSFGLQLLLPVEDCSLADFVMSDHIFKCVFLNTKIWSDMMGDCTVVTESMYAN